MKCPVCKTPLLILEYNEVETDYCAACKGVWLDSGELEGLLEAQGSREMLSKMEPSGKSRHKCPICGKRMIAVKAGKKKNVILDECTQGHGLWFDSGELEEVLRDSALENEKVNEHLKHVFGRESK